MPRHKLIKLSKIKYKKNILKAAHWKEGLWSVEFRSLEVWPWLMVCGWGLGPAHWLGSLGVEVGPWVGV